MLIRPLSCSRVSSAVRSKNRSARQVAELIPGARFEVMVGEAHQPFQEVPEVFNARVDAFWREVDSPAAVPQAPPVSVDPAP